MVTVKDLFKNYTNKHGLITKALQGVNLELPDCGLVFILGRSGCGKSTLLNLLGGIDQATSGKIIINDVDITALSDKERDIYRANNVGYVFQNFNLFEQLNVFENIVFGLPNVEEKLDVVDKLLVKLEVYECKYKNINELSGGQQQRVAIARALMKNSNILLADEPSGNLDQASGKMIFDILKEISKTKLVIVVTHDREIAESYGDIVAEMADGTIKSFYCRNENYVFENKQLDLARHKQSQNIKTDLKLSFSFMIKKKLKMIVSVFLLAISLGIMGVTLMCYQFNFGDMAAGILSVSPQNYMMVMHGYVDSETNKYDLTGNSLPIDINEINTLKEKYELEDIDLVYNLYGFNIGTNKPSSPYYYNTITKAMATTEEGISKYGFEVKYGRFPDGNVFNEIAITDFMANAIAEIQPLYIALRLGMVNIEAIKDDAQLSEALAKLDVDTLLALFGDDYLNEIHDASVLESFRENCGQVLLNSIVTFGGAEFKVVGILETGYNKQFGDILNADKLDTAQQRELHIMAFSLYNIIYVHPNTVEQGLYSNANYINIGNTNYYSKSNFTRVKDLPELNENEMLMSRNTFKAYFGEDFDEKNKDKYVYNTEISLTYDSGKNKETIYSGKDMMVVGVFDESNVSEIIFNDNYFQEYGRKITYISHFNFLKPKSEATLSKLINNLFDKNMSYTADNSFFVYEVIYIMDTFQLVFLIICLVLGAFSVFLMYNYFSMIVESQKKEIGIMRALGVSNKQINTIYLIAGMIITLITICLSWIVLSVLGVITNNILIKNLVKYSAVGAVEGLNVIHFTFIPFLLTLFLGILVASIAILIPNSKIKKMQPINAIRNE